MKSKTARRILTVPPAEPESSTEDCQQPDAPLPDGWKWMNVACLSSKEPNSITDGPFGSKLKTVHYTDSGPRVIRLQNVGEAEFIDARAHIEASHFDTLQKHRVFPGDIVIAALGERLPRACVVPEGVGPAIVKADCIRFKPDAAHVARYLMYALNWEGTRKSLASIIHGVGRPRLNLGEIKSIRLPVPSNAEQTAIVAAIEKQFTRLDTGVVALRRVQANLKRYRAAVLTAAYQGRLVPHEATLARIDARSYETGDQLLNRVLLERRQRWSGRGRYAEASLPEGAELPSIPVGWVWTTLDAIAEVKGGVTKDQKRKPFGARAVPYLRVANVQRGHLDLNDMKEILATEEEIAELALRPGDVLFNEGGDRDKLGRGWVWGGEIPVCIHQNHVFRARLYDRALQPKFVSWYANWLGQRFFFDEGKHTTNLASISMSKLRLLPIPVPPPAEQIRIVVEVERLLSVIDALKVALDANVLRASRLRESILHRAFSGRLSRAPVAASATSVAVSPQRRHFARAVLSAEIVTRLHREPTFGRIKHQKIFHLCEHVARLGEIQGEYHREAAGPLDNRVVYANEAELKKQHWFKTVRRDGHGHCYAPMSKAGGHRKYAERYWPTQLALIERLIELMRTWKTDRCEIFSTVYAAWNDLILWQRPATDDAIVHEVLNRWHSAKRQIPEARWRKAIQWVRENGFEPTGFGRTTASPE